MTALDTALWGILPYLVVLVLVGGTVWRYRYDRFGWTTRSSQMHESRLLRIGSPLFHFGILVVIIGHVIGLLIPDRWTAAIGVTATMYHVNALVLGIIAGVCTLAGVALLVYRRRTTGPVFSATTVNDKAMYLVLVLAILTGLATTLVSAGADLTGGHAHDYRQTVSVWFRSLFVLDPDVAAMSAATLPFKVHVLVGLGLFTMLPFTRLVHAFTAPVGYLFRPYVVYRSRGDRPEADERADRAVRPARRGWGR
ncbi:nitrate reductase gamma subunit [Nocardiopsis mwathae]|uniref:Nitrate reductase-like protein NarX n=1 Tax=Nocardiopsis mwathae TaxID=1472723 RepID=A0A7W9YGV6_9ACTN|nr:respiratory nitrate reductase subunit gamma [Nocardiopsis mwathae]MBB6171854.1 nitrate reductase gamma subunit [Nocardiopsis mwathae]